MAADVIMNAGDRLKDNTSKILKRRRVRCAETERASVLVYSEKGRAKVNARCSYRAEA